jgi:hypothetical protein
MQLGIRPGREVIEMKLFRLVFRLYAGYATLSKVGNLKVAFAKVRASLLCRISCGISFMQVSTFRTDMPLSFSR